MHCVSNKANKKQASRKGIPVDQRGPGGWWRGLLLPYSLEKRVQTRSVLCCLRWLGFTVAWMNETWALPSDPLSLAHVDSSSGSVENVNVGLQGACTQK